MPHFDGKSVLCFLLLSAFLFPNPSFSDPGHSHGSSTGPSVAPPKDNCSSLQGAALVKCQCLKQNPKDVCDKIGQPAAQANVPEACPEGQHRHAGGECESHASAPAESKSPVRAEPIQEASALIDSNQNKLLCEDGFGAEVKKFPPRSKKEDLNQRVNDFKQRAADNYLKKVSTRHESALEAMPVSNQARSGYFDKVWSAIAQVCLKKRDEEAKTKAFQVALAAPKEKTNSCTPFEELDTNYSLAQKESQSFAKNTAGTLDQLWKFFPPLKKANADEIQKKGAASATTASLWQEYQALWGEKGKEPGNPEEVGPGSIFGQAFVQMKNEARASEERSKALTGEEPKVKSLLAKCKSLGGSIASSSITGAGTKNNPEPASVIPAVSGNQADTSPPKAGNAPQKDPPSAKSSFLAKNGSMLMVGAAAVAVGVGGYALYKNKKRKEREAADRASLEAYVASNSRASPALNATGASMAPNAIPSAVKSLSLVIRRIPSSARARENMGTVEVALVDQNGVQAADSGLTILASCFAPEPCNLSGATTAITANGVAIFNGMQFMESHGSAGLEFRSSSAIQTARSPSFRVNSGAGQ